MTDLKEGKPEGKNHPPCTTHSPKPGTGVGLWGPKAEKLDCNSFPLPLLKQLGAAIIRGTRIWTGALLRPTRLALAGAIILWRVPRGIFWSGLGEVRCRGAKGASGLPPTAFTLRPLPPGSPSPLRSVLNLGTAPWGSPTGQAPPQGFCTLGIGAPAGTRATPPALAAQGCQGSPSRSGAQFRTWGSYLAVGGPHHRLPPGPRHLRTRPRLPAAARGSGAALLPPCSETHTRLSGTGAREGQRTATPVLAPRPISSQHDPPPAGSLQAPPQQPARLRPWEVHPSLQSGHLQASAPGSLTPSHAPRTHSPQTTPLGPPKCLILGATHFKPRPQSPTLQAPPQNPPSPHLPPQAPSPGPQAPPTVAAC